MAIEPLSSAMTYQAQTTQQAKPVQKTVVEDTEVSTPEKVSAYDATTVKVAETEKQDSQSGQENSYSNQQQANNEKIRKASIVVTVLVYILLAVVFFRFYGVILSEINYMMKQMLILFLFISPIA